MNAGFTIAFNVKALRLAVDCAESVKRFFFKHTLHILHIETIAKHKVLLQVTVEFYVK